MKTIKFSEVDSLIQSYCCRKTFEKPLLLWCTHFEMCKSIKHTYDGPLSGLSEEFLLPDNKKIIAIDSRGKEVDLQYDRSMGYIVYKPIQKKEIDKVIYHRYMYAAEQPFLDYCAEFSKKKQVPVICLFEDAGTASVLTLTKSAVDIAYLEKNFELYVVLGRTYDEWKSQLLSRSANEPKALYVAQKLTNYMDNHQDLYVAFGAFEDMPQEAVHTVEYGLDSAYERILKNLSEPLEERNVRFVLLTCGGPDGYYFGQIKKRGDFQDLVADILLNYDK